MAKCEWLRNEMCVCADCPACGDFCPVADKPHLCKHDTRDCVTSHSEREIVLECIQMMQGMVDDVKDYLDWVGVALPESEDEKFGVQLTYAQIVGRLLLRHTTHSGGTSTGMKCRELGFDYGDCVEFEFEEEDGEGAEDDDWLAN